MNAMLWFIIYNDHNIQHYMDNYCTVQFDKMCVNSEIEPFDNSELDDCKRRFDWVLNTLLIYQIFCCIYFVAYFIKS